MVRAAIFLFIFLGITLGSVFVVSEIKRQQAPTPVQQMLKTPQQNKQVEIDAVKNRNASRCDDIVGESYNLGPANEIMKISQEQAREQCRTNAGNSMSTPAGA